MNKKKFLHGTVTAVSLLTAALVMLACYSNNSSNGKIDSSTLGDTFSAASDAVGDATGGLNDKSGISPVALNILSPKEFNEPLTLKEKIYAALGSFNIESAAWAVQLTQWIYPPDVSTNNPDATSSDKYKNFSTAKGYSQRTSASRFQITGYAFLKWTNLSSGTISGTTKLQQAPHKKYTNTINNNYITVDGASTTTINCSAYIIDPLTTLPVGHTIVWTSATESTVSIDLIREKFKSDGTKLSGHEISTPSVLIMSIDKVLNTRTITSGTLQVYHQLADYYTSFTFSNVVYDLYTGDPASGTITISIKKDGSEVGTGKISYGSGIESYTYTFNAVTSTGSIDL